MGTKNPCNVVMLLLFLFTGLSYCHDPSERILPDSAPRLPDNPVTEEVQESRGPKVDSWPAEIKDVIIRRAAADIVRYNLGPKTSPSPPIGVLPGPQESKLLTRSLMLEKSIKESTKKDDPKKESDQDFSAHNNTEVFAQVGGTATLSCYTGHISDEVVTWLKREDDQLLTIGQELYANEDRFSASLSHSSKAWELFVRDVQLSDAGQYECQLTTHPPVTFLYSLKVKQAKADIRGPKEVHIEEGSQLDLQCLVKESPSPPVYIFWYHNGTMVNYERQRGLHVHLENFMSNLVVAKVTPSDAGIYTCDPHLATRATVVVHVVTGEKPAAMQHGRNSIEGSGSASFSPSSFLSLILPFFSILCPSTASFLPLIFFLLPFLFPSTFLPSHHAVPGLSAPEATTCISANSLSGQISYP